MSGVPAENLAIEADTSVAQNFTQVSVTSGIREAFGVLDFLDTFLSRKKCQQLKNKN